MQCSYRQVQDSSIGGSSDDEDLLGVIRGPSTFANAFLYIGEALCTTIYAVNVNL